MIKPHYKTCLLLEDDPEDQDFFLKTLQRVCSETRCFVVSNGEEAFCILKEGGIVPDLIFTDINMPRMNGFEFVKKLKEMSKFQDIPVITYSASHSPANIQRMQVLGVTAFYSKMQFQALPQILATYFGKPDSVAVV